MPLDPELITPSVADIATYIQSRVFDTSANRYDVFNEHTRPTAAQVQLVALRSARYVSMRVGDPDTDWAADEGKLASARDAAAIYAALTIENSYFADGSQPSSDGVNQLGRMAREQIDALVAAARTNSPGGWRIHSIPIVSAAAEPAGVELLPEQIVNGPDPDDET